MKSKKIFSIGAGLLACGMLFAGCTKADSASLADCTKKYDDVVSKYYISAQDFSTANTSQKNRYIFSGTYNDDKKVVNYSIDLYSQNAYSQNIYDEIQADNSTDQNMNFGLLKQGNEYETLATISLQYFEKRKTEVDKTFLGILSQDGVNIPQQEYTKLYNAICGLDSRSNVLANKKTNFVTSCSRSVSQTSGAIRANFENYLDAYNALLDSTFAISRAYQHIDENYFHAVDEETTQVIPDGELTRLVDSAILYCASTYFVKYMKNSVSHQIAFGHEGKTQDANFVSFKTDIVDKYSGAISDTTSLPDDLFQFQIAKKKLDSVIDDFEKYDDATAKIANYLKTNGLTQIDATRDDYFEVSQYCQFASLYEQSIANLQNIVISYVSIG